MLTADLVHVRRRGDLLQVVPLTEQERPRARELAETYLAIARGHLGLCRAALLEAWGLVALPIAESRLGRVLTKLVLDHCEFEDSSTHDPMKLRHDVFVRATASRRTLGQDFDRAWVLAEVARERGTDLQSIEEALYADLPAEHILRRALLPSPDGLLCEYDLGQHQAVLLRAVRVSVQVRATSPECYRALFRRLKFHRLLCTVTKTDKERGYRVEIDGPFSLFEQTTKYGLKLALALPAIMECEDWSLKAELRWGKDRRPLRYQLRGRTPLGGSSEPALAHAELPDEVTALLADLGKQPSPWKASPANAILNLPGFGVCVPDLVFVHRESGEEVFFEVLGFWSREAVWKRVEMVQAGLPHRIVFAVGKHLRVSAEVLEDGDSGALYVYARTMRATAVLECVAAVAARPHP